MPRDPRDLIPLKPAVFQILLMLADGDRHGWDLLRELQRRDGRRLLPGSLYRLMKGMMGEGLIAETAVSRARHEQAEADTGANAERRRYCTLTPFGRDVARAEARRLEALVAESHDRRLLSTRRPAR